jgi:aspartokinase
MVFDERIETTPGVVSFIYGLLSDNGINVQEEMSCWTDLMIIIDEKNAAKAMRVLSLAPDGANTDL